MGKLWKSFFNYALTSKYVDKIIVYSAYECKYLQQKFHIKPSMIDWTNFGMPDESTSYKVTADVPDQNGYFLDVGRSNRDHDFMVRSMRESTYNVHIVDYYYGGSSNNCKVIKDITFGHDLYNEIANFFAVVVPLADINISEGQTVFIQAMMFGKTIIVTESNTISEYVQDQVNGLIIKKNPEDLRDAMNELVNDKRLYCRLSENAKKMYQEKFTREKLDFNIGKIITN